MNAVRPYGDRAVLVAVPGLSVRSVDAALTAALSAGQFPPGTEVVPGWSTVAVVLPVPPPLPVEALAGIVGAVLADRNATVRGPSTNEMLGAFAAPDLAASEPALHELAVPEPALHELAVLYDGEDLEAVAQSAGLSISEVVARHSGRTYEVAFLGFAPGFAYLRGLDPALHLPRRPTPRIRVPAGSVAIGGGQAGVYPSASPGGWHLLGRTDAVLFDAVRPVPSLLGPADRVRFRPVTELATPAPVPAAAAAPPPVRGVVVCTPGITTIQDGGRRGWARLGVPASGAADHARWQRANILVGNPRHAAALEATVFGPELEFDHDAAVAIVGVGREEIRVLTAGSRLEVGSITAGARLYIAVAGGITTPPVLGSRATDTLSGLGPPPLKARDHIPVGPASGANPELDLESLPLQLSLPPVRDESLQVLPGPHATPSTWAALLGATHRVSPESSRAGVRLEQAIGTVGETMLASYAMVLGAIQLPPDGRPIILLPDHGTTGGYPVIAVVAHQDLDRLGQLRPGQDIRFSEA